MTRNALVLAGVLAISASAAAQSPDIDTPLLAAPANQREGATVIKWKPDFTYDTLRKGTNRTVCYDRSGQPGQQPFSLECTSVGNLDRVLRIVRVEGYVQSAPGFSRQPAVINGASDLLVEAFGEAGKHTRMAVGVSELPLNSAVELAVWAEVAP